MRCALHKFVAFALLIVVAGSNSDHTTHEKNATDTPSTAHKSGAHGAHSKQHFVLYWLVVGLGCGTLTQQFLSRYMPALPYTAVLLVEGVLIGVAAEIMKGELAYFPKLYESITMWESIDPHLILYLFLPALLFGDAMRLNVHLFSRCFSQCMLLACPGVLFGTLLTAACAKYLLPTYGWDWTLCLAFGSILSATDPVAVVALLNAVGASPILTMQITGESLLNDGTAIVIFNILFAIIDENKTYTAGELISYFCRLALGGPLLGLVWGFGTLWWMRKLSRTTSHEDSVLQITLTICCAYGSFFSAEELLEVSGVLCTVTAGEEMFQAKLDLDPCNC